METEVQKPEECRPLCSICVANYNGELYLEQCLDSILAQRGFPGSIEIIVHDDASTDESAAIIQSKYPQVHLLTSSSNVGFCVSNNRMAEVARGTFILLLNNDAVLHDDALKTLYAGSQKVGDGIFGLPQYNAETGELIDIGSTFDLFLNPIPNKNKGLEDVGMIIGACLWLPRTLWQQSGGFPEWFGSMAEDMYLCCLARLWGYPVKALNGSGFDHWVGGSFGGGKVTKENSLSTTKKRRTLSERNKTFVMVLCYPPLLLLLLLPTHLFLFCVEGVVLTVIKRDLCIWTEIYWNVLRELLQHRDVLFAVRSQVQGKRKKTLSSFIAPFSWIPHKLTMLIRYGIPEVK